MYLSAQALEPEVTYPANERYWHAMLTIWRELC